MTKRISKTPTKSEQDVADAYDYPFPREAYETDEQYLAQPYFSRHPEHVEAAKVKLFEWGVDQGFMSRETKEKK